MRVRYNFVFLSILLHFLNVIILGDTSSLELFLNPSLNKVVCMYVCMYVNFHR